MKKLVIAISILLVASVIFNVALFLKKSPGYVLSNALVINCEFDDTRDTMNCTVLNQDNSIIKFRYVVPPNNEAMYSGSDELDL